jgi:hypothetical protein
VDFVQDGGTLMTFLDVDLINALFGHALVPVFVPGPFDLDPVASAGTFFEGGPASIPNNNGTSMVDDASLPGGALNVYHDGAGESVVVVIPHGAGFIIFMGWDWFDAAPFGAQDGGWVDVLARATILNTTLP